MQETLIPLLNVLPGLAMAVVAIYYYATKKIPGLLWMVIAYVLLLGTTLAFNYLPQYIYSRAMDVASTGRLYQKIGIVSLLGNLLMLVGLIILLDRYPARLPKETHL
jgi:hypothetical protein